MRVNWPGTPQSLVACRLADARGRRVVLLSHCLLNANVRYQGGAGRPAMIDEIVDQLRASETSIVQMPCPEQMAWGGVGKPLMWLALGMKRSPLFHFRSILLPLFLWYTRRVFRRLARQTARAVLDYARSGTSVVGIVGIDGSPSCGVHQRLDLRRSFLFLAAQDPDQLDRQRFNAELYQACMCDGPGVFIAELQRHLGRLGLRVPLFAHSLTSELAGQRSEVKL